MPDRSFWKVMFALGVAVAAFVLVIAALLWRGFSGPLPSDAELRRRFREHRAEFDSLAALARADTLLVGAGIWPGSGVYVRDTPLNDRRLTEDEVTRSGRTAYRRLLARAGIPTISRSRGRTTITFVVRSSYGRLPARSRVPQILSSGEQRTVTSFEGRHRKGFVYSEEPVEPLLSSLDTLESYGYVALAPRWFLFLEPSD